MFQETIFRQAAEVLPSVESLTGISPVNMSPFLSSNNEVFRVGQEDHRDAMIHCRESSSMGIVSECSFAGSVQSQEEDSVFMEEEDDDEDYVVSSFRETSAATQASERGDGSHEQPLTMLLTFSMSQSFDSAEDQELEGGSSSLCDSFELTTELYQSQRDGPVFLRQADEEQEYVVQSNKKCRQESASVPDYKSMTEVQRQRILKSLYQRK